VSWIIGAVVGGALAALVAYPTGVSNGKAEYEGKKETLRQRLLEQLPNVPVPDWINLPEVLNWLQTCESEEVIKWAIETLNAVIDQWQTHSEFITTLLNSLKDAFQVPRTMAPRRVRKLQPVKAKEVKMEKTAKAILI